ncbi:hypothetical protein [Breoghania sp.]|uniref:hypothetical protein n=1 Tax=Breoghania sp. TaxID=2065378 RepID=UPI00261CEB57|nr:hypothetical protein [Breoghania sp.]MDJ0933188.1 hypothetical protein [Breoghania sp.]
MTTTMVIKTGDLNNSGRPVIYTAQIAGRSSGASRKLKMRSLDLYCDDMECEVDKAVCEKNMAIKRWYKSGHSFDPSSASKCQELEGRYQAECKAMLVKDLAIQNRDPSICKLLPQGAVCVRASFTRCISSPSTSPARPRWRRSCRRFCAATCFRNFWLDAGSWS